MIGIADFYKDIPTDPVENVQWRTRLIEICDDNSTIRDGIIDICARDVRFYASAFLWQFNPDETGNELGPWISYEFQNEALAEAVEWWMVRSKDYLWEKSRKMGASWKALFIQDWACRFHGWKKFIDVSHMEQAVVADDSDSLFWKIQHMNEHLPWWLQRGVEKSKWRFTYPETHSSIAGRSQTKRTGVGGRGRVFCDEVGKMENAKAIIGQTVATGPRFFVSTHYPEGTEFAKLCERPDLKKRILHWTMHPKYNQGLYKWDQESKKVVFGKWNQKTKQIELCPKYFDYPKEYTFITDGHPSGGPFPGWRSPWYDEESARYPSRRDVAIHLDIDRQGSESQVFDPMLISELRLTRATNPSFQGDIMLDSTGEVTQMIERYPGPLKIWAKLDPSGQYPPGPYGAGVDPARGSGATATCMSIVNAKTGEKVLEYRDAHIEPHEFAVKAVALCKLFHGALLVWEIPGPGIDFGRHVIKTCGYRKIWKQRTEAPHRMTVTQSDRPGWMANTKSTDELIVAYMNALDKRQFLNRSDEALAECLMFKWTVQGHVEHTHYKDESVDESGVGVNHGDLCFVAGTMVMTRHGERPIESIRHGDFVLTRHGWNRVAVAAMSSPAARVFRVDLSNGRQLTGTADHPVFTMERGWVSLSSLTPWDTMVSCQEFTPRTPEPRQLFSMASDTIGIPCLRENTLETTSGATLATRAERLLCMSRFGSIAMEKFHAAMRFITKMATRLTMKLPIWSALQSASIGGRTQGLAGSRGSATSSDTLTSASIVATNTRRSERIAQNSAERFAAKPIYARDVKSLAERRPVYNLSVEDCHEYFAEGVLVHNCIADALAWMCCVRLGIERPKSETQSKENVKLGSWLHRRTLAEEADRVYEEEYGLAE